MKDGDTIIVDEILTGSFHEKCIKIYEKLYSGLFFISSSVYNSTNK